MRIIFTRHIGKLQMSKNSPPYVTGRRTGVLYNDNTLKISTNCKKQLIKNYFFHFNVLRH